MLGLTWSIDDITNIRGGEEDGQELDKPSDKVRFPLSVIIRPEIIKDLRERFGLAAPPGPDPQDTSGRRGRNAPWVPKDAQHMAFLPKEDFMRQISGGDVLTNDVSTRPAGNRAPTNPHFSEKRKRT